MSSTQKDSIVAHGAPAGERFSFKCFTAMNCAAMKSMLAALRLISILAAAALPGAVNAQVAWSPIKPIRLILPFAPGGSTDRIGRLVSDKLQSALKQPVVTDFRPGAGGNLGIGIVAKALPDGYTLLLCSPSLAISPSLYRNPGYDAAKELTPVSTIATIPTIAVVHPSVPATTLRELVDLARRNPGSLNYGSGGVGSSNHLAGELFQSLAKVRLTHVPYKGTAIALYALITGETQLVMISPTAALPLLQQGKLRALAVLRSNRIAVLPNLPTAVEAGLPGWEVNTWYGLLTPAGTPREIVERLNVEMVKALNAVDAREALAKVGAESLPSTAAEFSEFLASETARFGKLVREAHIKVE
jgi:tripartite-type tricarboxylate transporter receptor subunit TctC